MSDPGRPLTAALADVAALVERVSADLSVAEEPANFAAALEGGEVAGDGPPATRRRSRTRGPSRPAPTPGRSAPPAITDWTLAEVAAAIRARTLPPVEVTRACLDRVERLDPRLHSFITVDTDGALRAARGLEAEAAAGRWRGPLHGVPLAYKDLCHVRGLPTSCGTKTTEYFTGEIECTAVSRLAAAGAITLGKLNMTELALGPFGENAHHGDVQNPWRLGHASGGSSSG